MVEGRRETEIRQYGEHSCNPTAQVIRLARKSGVAKSDAANAIRFAEVEKLWKVLLKIHEDVM